MCRRKEGIKRKSGRILIRSLISMCVLLMNRNEGNLFVLLLYVLALLIVLCIYLLLHFYVKTKVFLTRRANVVTEGGRQEEGSIGNMWVYNTICYSRKCSVCTVILTSVVKSQCTPEACCIWNESEWVVVLSLKRKYPKHDKKLSIRNMSHTH